jgi:hypothetical protein
MKLADLERALKAELDTGRLGDPVALRIHATFPKVQGDIFRVVGFFRPLLSLMGNVDGGEVHAKSHPTGKECAILWTDESGITVFLTLASGTKTKQSLHLLLIGNHGMTELHGGDAWSDAISSNLSSLWEKEIQESLQEGTSIRIKVS